MYGMIQIESVDKRNNPNSHSRYKKARRPKPMGATLLSNVG